MGAPGPDNVTLLHGLAAGLLPPGTGVAALQVRPGQQALFPEEAAHVRQAIPARRAEFAAGRAAARAAMLQLGLPPHAIPAGEDRAPVWPEGLRGSISHEGPICLAAVSTRCAMIGIDIERDLPLHDDLLPTVCTAAELVQIAGPEQGRLAKLIFSAKEAAYKAQYPLTGTILGFHHFDVTLEMETGQFRARYAEACGAFEAGDALTGRFGWVADHLVTAVADVANS